jgi:PAS domain S-box-containing protein
MKLQQEWAHSPNKNTTEQVKSVPQTRSRVARFVIISVLSGWIVLFVASRMFILRGFETLETEITTTQINRVENALDERLESLISKVSDWATWDEPYNYVKGEFPEFVTMELEDSTYIPLQLNLILMVDTSGQLVYAKSVDLVTQQGSPFPYTKSLNLAPFLNTMTPSSQLAGLVLLPDGPMLVAINPILPSVGKGQPVGVMLFGRYLDDAELEKLSGTTHLKLDIYRLDQSLPTNEERIALASISDTNPNFIHRVNEQIIDGYRVLQDIHDQPILLLRVQQTRDIYQQGLTSVFYFMLAISAISVLSALVFFNIADRLIDSQRKLFVSEQKYSALFHQAAIPAILIQISENTIVDINEAFEHTFGYSRNELVGKDWQNIGIVSAAEQAHIRTMFQSNLANHDHEIQLLKKSGKLLITPFKANRIELDGQQYAIATIHDLTDRKLAEEQLQSLSRRLVETQEVERRSLARELHDEIGQALTAVKMNLQATQVDTDLPTSQARLQESIRIVERTLRQTRDLSLDLRPSLLDDFGLVAALEWYLKREAERTGIVISSIVEPHDLRLPALLETTCYRIVQSAITNIIRHAQAKHARVEVRKNDANRIELIIQDDGVGFDVDKAVHQARRGASMGLLTMQERAQLVGGKIEFKSMPSQGTRICAQFPITE